MSTIRKAYIDILTELVTEDTQKLYLEDFLYYYNKAVSEYMKKRYELFEITQQLTDDLRTWKGVYESVGAKVSIKNDIKDYRHLLNCIVSIGLKRPDRRCKQKAGDMVKYKASRMTSNIKAGIINNEYLKATFFRPYFDIIGDTIEIYTGEDDKVKINKKAIYIEYLRQPTVLDMTEAQVREDVDNTQELEFPVDVADEIAKICLILILERDSNQRMQTHAAVNQSVNDLAIKG